MKHIYRVEYFYGKNWKKTYLGTEYYNEMFHFNSIEDAKGEIQNHHEYQRNHNKKLTKYRIIEIIYEEKIHENF